MTVPRTAILHKDARLHLHGVKTRERYLIDSGSIVSLLPVRLFKNRSKDTNLTLFAANSTPIPTYGLHIGDIDLELRRKFRWSFIIADIPEPILGADFLIQNNLLIDMRNRQLIDLITGLTTKGKVIKTNIHSISTIGTTMSYADL